jgi:hypothetical protein
LNSIEDFKRGFLKALRPSENGEEIFFNSLKLSRQYGISEPHVQEALIEMVENRLISIGAYDGAGVRPLHQWESARDLFFNTTDGGNFRAKILVVGAELFQELPKRKIGFATA